MNNDPFQGRRVLVADDETVNLRVLGSFLREFGCVPILADSGKKALELMDSTVDLVLLDVLMPGMDGFEVARNIKAVKEWASVPLVMVTALTSRDDRLKALESGANDFIAKPIDKTELRVRMASMLRMKRSQDELMLYQARLEEMVDVRTQALTLAVDNLREMQNTLQASHLETILRLASAAEYKDEHTASHIKRMSGYSARLAELAGLPSHFVELIRQASPMHDVGKMGVPDSILLKPGKLTPEEWTVMKNHTVFGRNILEGSHSELLQVAEVIAFSHHERWDGSGYPMNLAGGDIPVAGRICAVSDVFDALTTARPYKEAYSNEQALSIMRRSQVEGTHFDPGIFALFLDNLEDFLDIQRKFQD